VKLFRSARSKRALFLFIFGGLLVTPGLASGQANPLTLTKNVHVTKEDLDPTRLYSSPYLAVDPSNPNMIVGVTAELRTRRCGMIYSTDGGETWSQARELPAPNDYANCVWDSYFGAAAMGRDGHAYLTFTAWDERDGGVASGNMAALVARTDDLGDSWQTTLIETVRGKEGAAVERHLPRAIVVDTKSGSEDIVYVTFNRSRPNAVAPNAEPNRPFVAVSTDGGKTFGPAQDLSNGVWTDAARKDVFSSATTTTLAPNVSTTSTTALAGSRAAQPDQEANFGGIHPRLTIDDKGNVYALWRNSQTNVPAARPVAPSVFISVSKDHGTTWTTNRVTDYDVPASISPRIAWTRDGGPNGTLVSIFSENLTPAISGLSEVQIQRSTDEGKTWSDPQVITDRDPKSVTLGNVPTVSAAPNGRLDAAWFDTRFDPGIRAHDVLYAYSTDGGTTWSKPVRISDQAISRQFGVWGTGFDVQVPVGVASSNQTAVFGWDDTRKNDPSLGPTSTGTGNGVQDVYTSVVQFETLGTGGMSRTAKIVLAGVAGLGLVAIGLLLGSLGMRRRQPSTTKPAKRPSATTTPTKV
jgi:hypothetical protein